MFENLIKIYLIVLLILAYQVCISAQNSHKPHSSVKTNLELSYPVKMNTSNYSSIPFQIRSLDSVKSVVNTFKAKSNISYTKLAIVGGSSLAFLGGLYYRLKTAWWKNVSGRFHVSYDDKYVKNIDKLGHFYGAMMITEGFSLGLKWAGLEHEPSLLYGGLLSLLVYTGIEVKDGFAPYWGFDPGDMTGNLFGAFYPYLQAKVQFLRDFNFKWSYWPSKSPYYSKIDGINQNDQFFSDDYEGQTFWLSVNIKNYFPRTLKSFWPDFLNIAGGMSVQHLDGHGNGDYVFLISPDIDFQKLFKTQNSFLNSLFHYLNYLHFPLPAIQVSPDFKGYVIYLNP